MIEAPHTIMECIMKTFLLAIGLALTLSLTACGGGGDDGGDTFVAQNKSDPPVAPAKPATVCGTTFPAPAGC